MEKNSGASCIGFEGESRRGDVIKLIMGIYDKIPKDKKELRSKLRKILDGVTYKAPECIGESLMDVFHFLRDNIDLKDENKPPWVINIYNLWHETNAEFKNRS